MKTIPEHASHATYIKQERQIMADDRKAANMRKADLRNLRLAMLP